MSVGARFFQTLIPNVTENYKPPLPKTHKSQWYHGTLDRQEAESFITNFSKDSGTFLVRYSHRNKGANVLTLLNEDLFFNYIIRIQVFYKNIGCITLVPLAFL